MREFIQHGLVRPHIEPNGMGGYRLRYSLECELFDVYKARQWIIDHSENSKEKEKENDDR